MRIGIAFDLKSDFQPAADGAVGLPEDAFEEYDSEDTIRAIAGAIEALGHETVLLGGGRKFLVNALREEGRVDLVFNIAEGRGSRSREAHVPAACEMLGIPYTHSDPLTLAVTLDKPCAKRIVASHGIATAPFVEVSSLEDLEAAALPPFPLFAKPAWEGSSIGVRRRSRCADREALLDNVARLLAEYHQPVLVEGFLPGVEVTVGILGNGREAKVVGMMECAPRKGAPADFVYSLEVKRNWREEVEYHVPPRLAPTALWDIEAVALGSYRALGCRDVARVDVRLDAQGRANFIEVNPLPGLNPETGDLPILARRSGLDYPKLIERVLEEACGRTLAGTLSG